MYLQDQDANKNEIYGILFNYELIYPIKIFPPKMDLRRSDKKRQQM